MNSKKILSQYIQNFVEVNEEEVDQFTSCFEEVSIKKRQFIVQPNFIAHHMYYVVKGAFRAYVVTEEGNDHTTSFAIDDWWITDYNSFIYQQPASSFVMALEDSIILRVHFEKQKELKETNHKFETIFRIMAERGLAFSQRRITSNLTLPAERRYDQFMSKYAHVAQRLPQYALASFLGMTPEFLSKVKNDKLRKKS
ncbi:Crp/Fnr family transcriptional regulator [Algibacter lectus]|uniref:cAMP-binding protein n=1 Tax=Algibacter lectus TaxID=221126 RepID=A0A090VG26_9FLAO|nr:Crp/Fnr family transcriptional regulator [Algibacter lectus]GAL63740.1 cAMP-binding protein [Algibacter lectus]SFB91610.1 cAMP-binding domain of CRP or a regulatory subunit of cAMP-dependent protein kinases [Algibacter lectus]